MRPSPPGLAALALCLLAAGEARPSWAGPALIDRVVARVDGAPILLSDLDRELVDEPAPQPGAAGTDAAALKARRADALERLIGREVLLQEGLRQGIRARREEVEQGIAEIRARFDRGAEGEALPEARAAAVFEEGLRARWLSPEAFRERVAGQIVIRRLLASEVGGGLAPVEDREARAFFERVRAFVVAGSTGAPAGMGEGEAMSFALTAQEMRVRRAGLDLRGLEFSVFREGILARLWSLRYDEAVDAYVERLKGRAVIERMLDENGERMPMQGKESL